MREDKESETDEPTMFNSNVFFRDCWQVKIKINMRRKTKRSAPNQSSGKLIRKFESQLAVGD